MDRIETIRQKLSQNRLSDLLPLQISDLFFEALYGDKEEGAYDIVLSLENVSPDRIDFLFKLNQRPGKCLSCSLTYGLPNVFVRHPILDLEGLVGKIAALLDGCVRITEWTIGETREVSSSLHAIPLQVFVTDAGNPPIKKADAPE